jgi:hypothetical protein
VVVGKLKERINSCPSSSGGVAAVAHPVVVGKLRETLVVGMFPTEHFLDLLSCVSGAVVGVMFIQGSAPLFMQSQALHHCICRVKCGLGAERWSLCPWRGVARTATDVRFLVDL